MRSVTTVPRPNWLVISALPPCSCLEQGNTIRAHWKGICDEAKLSATDRVLLYGRQFLNPFAFYEAPEEIRSAGKL